MNVITPDETAGVTVMAAPEELNTRPPFSELFEIDDRVLDALRHSMRERGFDRSKPLNVWRDGMVVVDGHTRRMAAIAEGLGDVPICLHEFGSEDEAVEYAIANQRDRRNITNADLLRCIELVDRRREKGGDRRSPGAKSITSADVIDRSSAETARIVGTSTATVERARAIIDYAKVNPAIKKDVLDGKKSIRRAARDVADRKRKAAPAYEAVVPEPDARTEPTPSRSSVVRVDEATQTWLESHPIRARVVAHVFDEDALIYRHFATGLGAVRGELHHLVGLRSDEHASTLYRALLKISPLPSINSWTVCDRCQGTGKNGKTCKTCRGGGYVIPGFSTKGPT